jgi:hypothetical protein
MSIKFDPLLARYYKHLRWALEEKLLTKDEIAALIADLIRENIEIDPDPPK